MVVKELQDDFNYYIYVSTTFLKRKFCMREKFKKLSTFSKQITFNFLYDEFPTRGLHLLGYRAFDPHTRTGSDTAERELYSVA